MTIFIEILMITVVCLLHSKRADGHLGKNEMLLTMHDGCIRYAFIVQQQQKIVPNWLHQGVEFNGHRSPFIRMGNHFFDVMLTDTFPLSNHNPARHTPKSVQMNIEGQYYSASSFQEDDRSNCPQDHHLYVAVPRVGPGLGGDKVYSAALHHEKYETGDHRLSQIVPGASYTVANF